MLNIDESIKKVIMFQREKYDILLSVLELTERQYNVIQDMEMDELNKIIDLRQIEIDSLIRLDKDFSILLGEINQEQGISILDDINIQNSLGGNELHAINDSIAKIFKKIESFEKENNRILEENKKKLAGRLKKINTGKAANNGYQTSQVVQPFFYDRKTK